MKIPNIETRSKKEIEAFQEQKLKETLAYVSERSPFYKRLFAAKNIDLGLLQIPKDFQKLPFTTKDDLQQCNDDFFCVPKAEIIDYVTTSGTLGSPVVVGLTHDDLDRLAYNEAISLACSGITKNDTIQLMTTLDRRFMAGLAYFMGLRKLGASVIRVGSGVPELQWDSILKFQPTYLICVPSFLLKLLSYAKDNGIDVSKTSVTAAVCIGEPIRDEQFQLNSLGKRICKDWDIQLFSTYAATEMQTAFNECAQHQGGHLHPELIFAEILDDNNQPVNDGQTGELVITSLGVTGMPLVRFKTGDMIQKHSNACACGRTTMRVGPVTGRKQHMIKYKGTTLYPPAMYNLLGDCKEVNNFIIEIFHNEMGTDEIILKVATSDTSESFKEKLKDHFRAKLRVLPTVVFASEEDIKKLRFPKLSRKPVLLIDNR